MRNNSILNFLQIQAVFCIVTALLLTFHTHAQLVERVYPERERPSFLDVISLGQGGLYAAGTEGALLHSTDNGTHWEDATISGAPIHFHALTGNSTTLYLLGTPTLRARAELSNQNEPFVLLRFVGPGKQAIRIDPDIPDRSPEQIIEYGCVRAVDSLLFVSYGGDRAGIVRSTDAGETWNAVMLPDRADTMYGYFIFESLGDQGILVHRPRGNTRECYTSKDNGASWLRFDCPRIARMRNGAPAMLYLREESVLAFDEATRAITVRGDDGRWLELSYPPFSEVSAFEMDAAGVLYVGSNKGGLYASVDTGRTWNVVRAEIPSGVGVDSRIAFAADASVVVVNTLGEILRSTDQGVSWDVRNECSSLVGRVLWADGEYVLTLMLDKQTGISEYHYSTDNARTFSVVRNVPGQTIQPVTPSLWFVRPRSGTAGDTLLYRSTDQGSMWTPSLLRNDVQLLNAFIPQGDAASVIIACTKGLLLSTDGGVQWRGIQDAEWNSGVRPAEIHRSPTDGAVWYTFSDGTGTYTLLRGDVTTGEWRTALELTTEEKSRIFGISRFRILDDGSILAAGVIRGGSLRERNLVLWYSNDNGVTWQTYETRRSSTDVETKVDAGATISPNGALFTNYQQAVSGPVSPVLLYGSDDLGVSDSLLLEICNVFGLDLNASLVSDGHNGAYYAQALFIHHLRLPKINSTDTQAHLPLPLVVDALYPQPARTSSGVLNVQVRSARRELVLTRLHDLAGKTLREGFATEIDSRGSVVPLPIRGLAAGSYLLTISTSTGVLSRHIVIQ